jgi:hypothetical protein
VASAVITYAVLVLLFVVGPDPSIREAHLICSNESAAVFSDMDACVLDPRFKAAQCSCLRPPSEWARWYGLVLVPMLGAAVGYALLRGTRLVRLLLVNVAFLLALITVTIRAFAQNAAAAALVVPSLPLVLLGFAVGATVLFLLLDGTIALIRRATTSETSTL